MLDMVRDASIGVWMRGRVCASRFLSVGLLWDGPYLVAELHRRIELSRVVHARVCYRDGHCPRIRL